MGCCGSAFRRRSGCRRVAANADEIGVPAVKPVRLEGSAPDHTDGQPGTEEDRLRREGSTPGYVEDQPCTEEDRQCLVFNACDLRGRGHLEDEEEVKMALAGLALFPSSEALEDAVVGTGQSSGRAAEVDLAGLRSLAGWLQRIDAACRREVAAVPFALRGMRLSQLEAIRLACGCGEEGGWLASKCQTFNSLHKEAIDTGSCHQMVENLYALDQFFVRPATAGRSPGFQESQRDAVLPEEVMSTASIPRTGPSDGRSCSFAQLVNPMGLEVDYFVSHSWAHAFARTVASLRAFAREGRHAEAASQLVFWICLFAVNQHNVAGDVGNRTPDHGPFIYALTKARIGAVMVLDENVEPFRRIWCLFEVHRVNKLGRELKLISDGGALESSAAAAAIAQRLQEVSAFEAQASVLADKVNIMHQIMNPSVAAAFPLDTFRAQFDPHGRCCIGGFSKRWFSHFDADVSRLLATPLLHAALSSGDVKVALQFLGLGGQCSAEDLEKLGSLASCRTPLHRAWVRTVFAGKAQLTHVQAHFGNVQLLRWLLEAAADVTAVSDLSQRQPLHLAVKSGHQDVTSMLLAFGAPAACTDSNMETALQLAAYGGHRAIANLLLEHGAHVNSRDNDGWTPLSCAARSGHVDVVKLLLSHRANPDAADGGGRTALRHAQLAGHKQVALLFENAMGMCDAFDENEEDSDEDEEDSVKAIEV